MRQTEGRLADDDTGAAIGQLQRPAAPDVLNQFVVVHRFVEHGALAEKAQAATNFIAQ
jgi:hypothetical protein